MELLASYEDALYLKVFWAILVWRLFLAYDALLYALNPLQLPSLRKGRGGLSNESMQYFLTGKRYYPGSKSFFLARNVMLRNQPKVERRRRCYRRRHHR